MSRSLHARGGIWSLQLQMVINMLATHQMADLSWKTFLQQLSMMTHHHCRHHTCLPEHHQMYRRSRHSAVQIRILMISVYQDIYQHNYKICIINVWMYNIKSCVILAHSIYTLLTHAAWTKQSPTHHARSSHTDGLVITIAGSAGCAISNHSTSGVEVTTWETHQITWRSTNWEWWVGRRGEGE